MGKGAERSAYVEDEDEEEEEEGGEEEGEEEEEEEREEEAWKARCEGVLSRLAAHGLLLLPGEERGAGMGPHELSAAMEFRCVLYAYLSAYLSIDRSIYRILSLCLCLICVVSGHHWHRSGQSLHTGCESSAAWSTSETT